LFAAASFLAVFGAGCVSDPSLRDPFGPGFAEISGSPKSGPSSVDIAIAAIDDEPRVVGTGPLWKRRITPGRHRVTVYVQKMVLSGRTEFSFEARTSRKYQIRARDGGGFYFVELVDVTTPGLPEIVLFGRFAATGSMLVESAFVALPFAETRVNGSVP
jgi:hypothetical protein